MALKKQVPKTMPSSKSPKKSPKKLTLLDLIDIDQLVNEHAEVVTIPSNVESKRIEKIEKDFEAELQEDKNDDIEESDDKVVIMGETVRHDKREREALEGKEWDHGDRSGRGSN